MAREKKDEERNREVTLTKKAVDDLIKNIDLLTEPEQRS
jgi:hypothetical protein